MGAQGVCDGDFGGATASNEGFLLDQAADDTEGIVKGAFCFVEDEGVGAAADDGDSLTGGFVGDACDFYGAGTRGLDFFKEVRGTEFIFCK